MRKITILIESIMPSFQIIVCTIFPHVDRSRTDQKNATSYPLFVNVSDKFKFRTHKLLWYLGEYW